MPAGPTLRIVTTVVLLTVLALAAALDVRTRRIPNVLTVGALLAALALQTPAGGTAVLGGLGGAALALLFVVPFFLLGALGGGDAKLIVAAGAFLGPAEVPGALGVTALAGGVLAIAAAVRAGALVPMLRSSAALAARAMTLGRSGSTAPAPVSNTLSVPYGVAIAIGVATWWLGRGLA